MPGARHRRLSAGTDYSYLDHADAAGLAWEWLRRDADYRALAPSSWHLGPSGCVESVPVPPELGERWGCLNVAPSDCGADTARLLWSAEADPSVITVAALPAGCRAEVAFDLAAWGDRVTIVRNPDCEHVLVRTGRGALRFDVRDGTVLNGPVRLFFDVMADAVPSLLIHRASRLRDALRKSDVIEGMAGPDSARRRQIAALRTFDALAEGASIRDVAIMLFGRERVAADWNDPSEALKSHSRRLIAHARRMAAGAWREILKSSI